MFYFYPFIDNLFKLKFSAKELLRNAKNCEKEENIDKGKLKKVLFFIFTEK
jgi:hypothetical protein